MHGPAMADHWQAAGMAADGLTVALEDYQRAQDELVEARNRLAHAIAGAAMSGMTKDEIVEAPSMTVRASSASAKERGSAPDG
jgi:hypothetical protein